MLKQGDIVAITFRHGYDNSGNSVMQTFERCEIAGISGSTLNVNCRVISNDHTEIQHLTFDINAPEFVGVATAKS